MNTKTVECEIKITKTIEYWYNDGWDGEIDEFDIEYIQGTGCIEGQLATYDTNTDQEHLGWWKILD